MKKTLLLCLLALPFALHAQDTAEMVVNRYLQLLNYEALPKDSMLVMETTITYSNSIDTFVMRRYYQPEGMMRVEVWQGDTLTTGMCTNGSSRHRVYYSSLGWWEDKPHVDFHKQMQQYDFRGILYGWHGFGIKLTYLGMATVDKYKMHAVRSEQMNHYNRTYFFDPNNGLLVLVTETDEMPEGSRRMPFFEPPIDFKFTHEYLPIGQSLLPSVESYQRNGELIVMRTTAHFEPRNNLLFNQD